VQFWHNDLATSPDLHFCNFCPIEISFVDAFAFGITIRAILSAVFWTPVSRQKHGVDSLTVGAATHLHKNYPELARWFVWEKYSMRSKARRRIWLISFPRSQRRTAYFLIQKESKPLMKNVKNIISDSLRLDRLHLNDNG
jgi:hypothetical protein